MGLFSRRRKLPAAYRPALSGDERVLDWAEVADDEGAVIATNLGLWLPGQERLGWHEVHKAAWSGRELAVTPAHPVAERDDYLVMADQPVRTYLLPDPGRVPEQVRNRVTRSVAYTAYHQLANGGVRVVARRVSGVDGLTWTVRYDPGTLDDEQTITETDRLVMAARAAVIAGQPD